jgi:hypothetical protein
MKKRSPRGGLLGAVLLPLAAVLFAGVLFTWNSFAEAQDFSHSEADRTSLKQELIDLQKAFVNANERGDADYVRNALAEDFVLIQTNGNTSDKVDFTRDIHPVEQPGSAPILYDFKVLRVDESCAIVIYKAVFPDEQLDKYQHLSDVWVKQGKGWKLKLEQSTLNLWSAHDLD